MIKYLVLLTLIPAFGMSAVADDATTELFNLLNKGDCVPSSLTSGAWTITTGPVGTHGELNWGDELVFEQIDATISVARKSKFNIWKNGALWTSANGWTGSCVRDGKLSLYVVKGEIELEGCLHELAIGRLDHDDSLANRVEVIFQDKDDRKEEVCTHGGGESLLHPGHAHGNNY
jgi:hypothetical protein